MFLKVSTLLTILTIAHVSADPKLSKALSRAEPQCTTAGWSCIDCWTSLLCIVSGNGELLPLPQACDAGKSCRSSSGTCEDTGNYQCSSTETVQCQAEGMFPNPYDCKKYFTCVKNDDGALEKYESECGGDYAYDPYRKQCSRRLDADEQCTSPVKICNKEFQSGVVDGNPSLFYWCASEEFDDGPNFVPQIYSCPLDYVYDGYSCSNPFPSFVNSNGRCITSGYFPHAKECQSYYTCVAGISPQKMSCIAGYRFDAAKSVCVLFHCDTCHI